MSRIAKSVNGKNRPFYSCVLIVACPLYESKAGVDLVLIETFQLFLC